jgi:hypothetical protein
MHAMAERDISQDVGDDYHQDEYLSFTSMAGPEGITQRWLERSNWHLSPKDFSRFRSQLSHSAEPWCEVSVHRWDLK